MNLKTNLMVLWLLVLFFSGCSFKNSSANLNKLKIILEEAPTLSTLGLGSDQYFGLLANPTSTGDFNCFTVNITGPGMTTNNYLANCSSSDNGRGRGLGYLAKPSARGTSIEVDIPGGNRAIDVYGVYPPVPECTGSQTAGGSAGYYLGGTVQNIVENSAITIPIAYNSGTTGTITCNGGGSSYKTYLYVGDNTATGIYPYSININGSLSALTSTPLAQGIIDMAASKNGKYLFAAYSTNNTIQSFAINSSDGSLSANAATTTMASQGALAVDPSEQFVLVGSAVPNSMNLTYNALTGVLAPLGTNAASMGAPKGIAIHPNGFAYYANDTSLNIVIQTVNTSTGAFAGVATTSTSPDAPKRVVIDYTNNRLYAVAQYAASDKIYGWSINTGTGVLTALPASPYSIGASKSPIDLVLHPTGNFLYVAENIASGTVEGFVINANGSIGSSLGTVAAGSFPRNIVAHPSGDYIYVLNQNSHDVFTYLVNQATGTLSFSSSFTTPATSATGLAIARFAQ